MSNTLVAIGGMDPTGGAGLLRDAWTIEALGFMGELLAIATALTRQGQGRPAEAFPVAPEQLRGELARLHDVAVIKLGMVASPQIPALAEALARLRGEGAKVVLDPVLRASDGGWIGAQPVELLELARHVDVITPNQAELAALRAAGPIPCAVLSKGEPVGPERIRDRLLGPEGREWSFERARVPGPDPRGTGCALASAIACELGRGCTLELACARAIEWLDHARLRQMRGRDDHWHLALD